MVFEHRPPSDTRAATQGLFWHGLGSWRRDDENPAGECVDYPQGPQPKWTN